ncbi:MAG: hypothetical protein BRC30_01970 [Nanohaloarchaea archaeon SW_7_46_7]|nr:MAG: hypothetical protein BRC30_01970 [Nanohaloarchaea archaeon SW_7_46_7]
MSYMLRDKSEMSTRKGITPIIATVLLLGITVAIGLTVYTQAQGLLEGAGDTSNFDRVRATSISLSPVYSDGGMQLQVSNKGDRAINVTDYTIYYGPPNYDPVTWEVLDAQTDNWVAGNGNKCFTSEMKDDSDQMQNNIIEPGDRATCSTGVAFPGALESVEIKVEADDFNYDTGYTCSVDSSSAKTC